MINTFRGAHRASLLKFGSLVALPLMAAALAPSAGAQVRGPRPVVASPPADGAPLRGRIPRPTPSPTTSDCPDPIEARRAGRTVPAGCPGGEQAPVRVDYAEQPGEDSGGRRGGGSPIRNYGEGRGTPVATPPGDGRIRRRVPVEDRAGDAPGADLSTDRRGGPAIRTRTIPDADDPAVRGSLVRDRSGRLPRGETPVDDRAGDGEGPAIRTRRIPAVEDPEVRRITRDRGGRVVENELPAENSGYEDRRRDSGGITRIAPTPDDPRMRYNPDRGGVARTPDEEAPPANGRRRQPWERQIDDPVATRPDGDRAPIGRVPRSEPAFRDATPTPTPVRPVRPVGGNVPSLADHGVSGQIECIIPRPDTNLVFNVDTTAAMLCGFPGPGKSMSFRLTPSQWGAVQSAYAGGFAVRLTHGPAVNGVYPVFSVTEGSFARRKGVCVPVHASYNAATSLTVGNRNEGPKPYRMWCTSDGKVVTPFDLRWFIGSMYPELRDSAVEDGPIEVGYFDISTPYTLDTVRPLGHYPEVGTNWMNTIATADKDKVNKQAAYPSGYRYTYAEPPLTGRVWRCVGTEQEIAAGICRGHGKEPEFVWTQYKAYATPAVISESKRPPKEKQTKTVYYTLMPGIIPVQHRAEAGGACRVILAVELEMKWIPGGVGVHYADENRPDPNARHGVGVPSAPAAPVVPKADSCN
jgi:hypothetical protein